eukprot:6265288-Alexandrium_andersonii.AAC.1
MLEQGWNRVPALRHERYFHSNRAAGHHSLQLGHQSGGQTDAWAPSALERFVGQLAQGGGWPAASAYWIATHV